MDFLLLNLDYLTHDIHHDQELILIAVIILFQVNLWGLQDFPKQLISSLHNFTQILILLIFAFESAEKCFILLSEMNGLVKHLLLLLELFYFNEKYVLNGCISSLINYSKQCSSQSFKRSAGYLSLVVPFPSF